MSSRITPDMIQNISLFRDLSLKEKQAIAPTIIRKIFEKNKVISTAGESCREIFFVLSGRVKIFRTSLNGREQILEILGSGDTCACNPGATQWSCSSSAQAMSDCELGIVSRSQYVQMVKSNSTLAQALTRIFAQRLCRMSSLVEEVSLDAPEKRLIKFLLNMSESVPGISFTHEEIAQRLGLVRETVTRHLKKLKDKALVDLKPPRILICDKEALEKQLLK